ncbi:MAG: hypothetical protein VZR06_15260 [Butyrivibrio sp.]|nr:hypothetical protein [Butyrivibrio sp.]
MKKNLHFILYVLLGMGISVAIYYVALMIEFNLLATAMIFVVPVGGLLFGGMIGFFAKEGMFKDNTPFNAGRAVFLSVAMIVLFIFLTYLDYLTCYVTDTGDISRLFKGEHVSKVLNGFGFKEYFHLEYFESEVSISTRGNRSHPIEIEGSQGWNFVVYLLQYIGAIVSVILGAKAVNGLPVCDKCGKYLREKEIERYFSATDAVTTLNEFDSNLVGVNKYVPERIKATNYRYTLKAHYCSECQKGHLQMYEHAFDGKNHHFSPVAYKSLTPDTMMKLGLIKNYGMQGYSTMMNM